MKLPRGLLILATGHFLVDNCAGMLGAFLPFLQEKLSLSLSQAGLLAGVLMFSSSLMQPLYGYLADRWQTRGFALLGPAVAAVFISSLGLAPGFEVLIILLVIGGIGIAAFHPQAASMAAEACRLHNQSSCMALFITAGTLGYGLGPIYITAVIAHMGLSFSYLAAIPAVLFSGYFIFSRISLTPLRRHPSAGGILDQLRAERRPLLILYFLVVSRAMVSATFASFLSLYYISLGMSELSASQILTTFLLAGGFGGFLGGILADRYGNNKILVISMIGSLPFLVAFLLSQGLISVIFCVLGGAILLCSTPVNLLMAQKLVPHGASTISALMMGFAWGVGGLLVPLVGVIADHYGLLAAFTVVTIVTIPGFLLSLLLPSDI